MKVLILTTGGTIDKVYFDAKSTFEIGTPIIEQILQEALVTLDYRVEPVLRKDSLEMTDEDRQLLHETISNAQEELVLITHGTDTMSETGRSLSDIPNKTIVITGSLSPARFRSTDAIMNIGLALGALQSKSSGVYICMNGQVFEADKVKKNRELNQFEHV